jgi:hypothetical protein
MQRHRNESMCKFFFRLADIQQVTIGEENNLIVNVRDLLVYKK